MHAEILLSCQLVGHFHGQMSLPNIAYIHSLHFQPEHRPILKQLVPWQQLEQSTQYWFDSLRRRHIQDMRLDLFGQYPLIYTRFNDGTLSAWCSDWQFNDLEQQWDIDYYESLCKLEKFPVLTTVDNRQDFLMVLHKLEHLAQVIGETQFAQIFHRAAGTLAQTSHSIRELQQQLFWAAQQAWVFGGMGSWNDAAPYLAAEQGLEQDYQHLTEQLHRQIRQALMYAVNFAKTSSRTTT